MKRHLADMLKRTARTLIKLANRIDGPTITYYDDHWQKLVDSGKGVSKGVARRAAGVPDPLPDITEQTLRLVRGLAGARPESPNG